jgi:hypothetical protein
MTDLNKHNHTAAAPGSFPRVLLASCLCTFIHGSFFYHLVKEQLFWMRQKQAALESMKIIAVPGTAFLDSLGWSAPLYGSLFYLILLGVMFLGFLLLSLVFASPLKRAIFLSLGLLVLAGLTLGDRIWCLFLTVIILSFGSFHVLTFSSRIHFAKKEILAILLVVGFISFSLFYGSQQRFFLKARDRVLFGSAPGNGLVSLYYQYSPLAAGLITPEKGIYQGLLFDKEIKDGNTYYVGHGVFVTGNPAISGSADFEISRGGGRAFLSNRFGKRVAVDSITPQGIERGITALFGMKGFVSLNKISLYAFPGAFMILIIMAIRWISGDKRVFVISLSSTGFLTIAFIWIVSFTGNSVPTHHQLATMDISRQGLSVAYYLHVKNEVPHIYGPTVVKMVYSESPALRYWGAHLLGIGGNKEDVGRVKSLLEDPVPNVRYTAARSLYRLIDKESLNSLFGRLVSDPSWYVRCKVYSLFIEAGMIPSPG